MMKLIIRTNLEIMILKSNFIFFDWVIVKKFYFRIYKSTNFKIIIIKWSYSYDDFEKF